MALTPSTMVQLETKAPDFKLPDYNNKIVSRDDFKTKTALLVMFICNHCPYVKHIRKGLSDFYNDYKNKDIGIVAINANDAARYPDDSPENMKKFAKENAWGFPYLIDEKQDVAKSYRAACTPDFFLFNKDRKLVYRGQFDDSRPESGKPVTGRDLRGAVDALLSARPVTKDQKPSIGCNIKWKAGNEPSY